MLFFVRNLITQSCYEKSVSEHSFMQQIWNSDKKRKMKLVLGWVTNAMFECLSIFTKGTWGRGGGGGIEKPLGLYVVANIKNISIFSTSLRSWVQFCEYQPPFEIFFEYFPQVFIADHFYNNFISEIKLYSKYEYVCVCVCVCESILMVVLRSVFQCESVYSNCMVVYECVTMCHYVFL